MKVLDHAPHRWFLLDHAGALFLDTNCSNGAVAFDVLVELRADEAALFRERGRGYLDQLSDAVDNDAPRLASGGSPYAGRDLSAVHRERVDAAIRAWRAGGSGAQP